MIFKIIILAILSLGFSGFSIYLHLKKNTIESDKRLSHFTTILSCIFIETLVLNLAGPQNTNPLVVYLSLLFFPLCLALPVAMYFYCISLIKTNDMDATLNKTIPHYSPAILLLIINTFSFIALYVINQKHGNYALLETMKMFINFFSLFIVFLVSNVVYIYKGFNLYQTRKLSIQSVQNKRSNNTLVWMKWFLIAYAVQILILYTFQLPILSSIKEISRILMLCYLFFIVYYGSRNSEFNEETDSDLKLDNSKKDVIQKELEKAMVSDKLYLDQSLSIQSLSLELKTNTKYLSYVINNVFDKNFSSFINEYRIEDAKNLFLENAHSTYTIESISKMTGFKSKSAFYYAFKKYTGMTPTKFIQMNANEIEAN